jgi:hypothetical protein
MNFNELLNHEKLWDLVVGVSAILVGALIFWLAVSRTASRVRHRYETLLDVAAQSLDPASELALVQRKLTALRLIVNTTRYVLAFIVMFMLLAKFNVTGVTALLFPAGFLGAALGLGGQNLVRDIVAGLFMVFENQFAVGDIVSINGTLGSVEEIGLRVTRLRDDSGQVHFFANGAITAVSKYPRRTVPLLIWLPLATTDSGKVDTATVHYWVKYVLDSTNDWLPGTIAAVQQIEMEIPDAPAAFSAALDNSEDAEDFTNEMGDNAPQSTLQGAEPAAMRWLCWRFVAHPARAAMLREKLPGRLTAALQAAGITIATGAAIEVITAPAQDLSA